MLSANEIKRLRSLGSKKGRDSSGLFIVEGEKMVSEALASGFEVVEVYRSSEIGEEAMGRISCLSSPSPALAVLKMKEAVPFRPGPGLFLILDSIRDPGNLGTILRIADWFGVEDVVASPDTVELYNPKTVQATMGAIFRVRFHSEPLLPFLEELGKRGGKAYGTFLDGQNIYSTDLDTGQDSPVGIIIGNESRGISPEVGTLVSGRLLIPPFPGGRVTSESLNAAVATAVTLSEFRRRIWQKG